MKTIFCAYASVCVLCVVADAVCVCMCVCVQDAGKLGTAACNTLRFGTARDTSTMANGISHI